MFLDFGGVCWKKSAPAHASAAAGQNFLFPKGQIVKHLNKKLSDCLECWTFPASDSLNHDNK